MESAKHLTVEKFGECLTLDHRRRPNRSVYSEAHLIGPINIQGDVGGMQRTRRRGCRESQTMWRGAAWFPKNPRDERVGVNRYKAHPPAARHTPPLHTSSCTFPPSVFFLEQHLLLYRHHFYSSLTHHLPPTPKLAHGVI